jgi:hypothetical protein
MVKEYPAAGHSYASSTSKLAGRFLNMPALNGIQKLVE